MPISDLRKGIFGKVAAAGVGIAAAVTPLSATFANDSSPTVDATTVSNTTPSETLLTQEQYDRVMVDMKAFNFAKENYGSIGVSVLGGDDLKKVGKTAEDFAQLYGEGIERKFGIKSAGFAGDNGTKPTEITFHYQLLDTDNHPIVHSVRGLNVSEAIAEVPNIIAEVQKIKDVTPMFAYNMD